MQSAGVNWAMLHVDDDPLHTDCGKRLYRSSAWNGGNDAERWIAISEFCFQPIQWCLQQGHTILPKPVLARAIFQTGKLSNAIYFTPATRMMLLRPHRALRS